jgi:hypothetical protein
MAKVRAMGDIGRAASGGLAPLRQAAGSVDPVIRGPRRYWLNHIFIESDTRPRVILRPGHADVWRRFSVLTVDASDATLIPVGTLVDLLEAETGQTMGTVRVEWTENAWPNLGVSGDALQALGVAPGRHRLVHTSTHIRWWQDHPESLRESVLMDKCGCLELPSQPCQYHQGVVVGWYLRDGIV